MEALGYSQNGEPFLELARRVPYRLLSEAVLKLSGGERRYEIQANLLWAAGFQMPLGSSGHHSHSPVQAHRSGSADEDGRRTPRNRPDVLADTGGLHIPGTSKAAGLWGSHRVKPMGLTRWHTFRVRPQNHPRRRIVGFAHVLDLFLPSSDEAPEPWAQKGLMNGMACLLERSSDGPGIVRGLEAGLMGMAQARSRVASYYGSRQEGLIGRGRARDMAVNCVLPFFHALADFRGDETLERLCLRVYRGLPRLQENEITREMWGQLSYPLVGTGGGEAREAYVELASGWERLPQAVDDGGSPAEPSGRVEGLRKEVVCNARRQQGLLHLHNLIASPGKAPLWRSA